MSFTITTSILSDYRSDYELLYFQNLPNSIIIYPESRENLFNLPIYNKLTLESIIVLQHWKRQ
jgi:hypothetical protein